MVEFPQTGRGDKVILIVFMGLFISSRRYRFYCIKVNTCLKDLIHFFGRCLIQRSHNQCRVKDSRRFRNKHPPKGLN